MNFHICHYIFCCQTERELNLSFYIKVVGLVNWYVHLDMFTGIFTHMALFHYGSVSRTGSGVLKQNKTHRFSK